MLARVTCINFCAISFWVVFWGRGGGLLGEGRRRRGCALMDHLLTKLKGTILYVVQLLDLLLHIFLVMGVWALCSTKS